MILLNVKKLLFAALFLSSISSLVSGEVLYKPSYKLNLKVLAQTDVIASSQTVPLQQMVSGWRSLYRYGGDHAFADASAKVSFAVELQPFLKFDVSKGYRYYYYFAYDPQTADFFFRTDNKLAHKENYVIDLQISAFESPELAFSLQADALAGLDFFELPNSLGLNKFTLGLTSKFYQPGHFQFADLNGQVKTLANGDVQASAQIDYSFDQDKLLAADEDIDGNQLSVAKGFGYSFDIEGSIAWQYLQADVVVKDIYNQFRWDDALFQSGCINILNAGNGVACTTSGSSNGKSGRHQFQTFIEPSWQLSLSQTQWGVTAEYFQHQRYQRLALAKSVQTKLGQWSVFLYHPTQLGFAWQYGLHKLSFATDRVDLDKSRDISLQFSTGWRW